MTEENKLDVNRRKFMKRAAAASAITLGVAGSTGSAVARSAPASQQRAESMLSAHGGAVLSLLEDEGVLRDRSELPTSVGNDFNGVAAGAEGAARLEKTDGSEEIHVVSEVEAGKLTVTVQPDQDRAYAILDTGSGLVGYNVEQGVYDFEPQADCTCMNVLCDSTHRSEECCGEYDCYYLCGCN